LVVEVDDQDGSATGYESLTVNGVTLKATPVEVSDSSSRASALTFSLGKSGTEPALVDVIVTGVLPAGSYGENSRDLTGFVIGCETYSLGVTARDTSGEGVDAYWFGPSAELTEKAWTQQTSQEAARSSSLGFSLAWLRRSVPVGDSTVTLLITFQVPPVVTLSGPQLVARFDGENVTLEGSVSPADSNLLFFFNDIPGPQNVSPASDGVFEVTIDPTAYLPEGQTGVVSFTVIARHATGGYSLAAVKYVDFIPPPTGTPAMTPRATDSPRPSLSASPIQSLDPTVTIMCDGLQYKGTPTSLSVDGPGTVTVSCAEKFGRDPLESLHIGKSVLAIEPEAFAERYNLFSLFFEERQDNALTTIGASAFIRCSSLTTVSLPGKLQEIGNEAFAYTSLEFVSLPASLQSLTGAFYGSPVATIVLEQGSATFSLVGGVLYSKDSTALILYPQQAAPTSFNVPSTVTDIETTAFALVTNLLSVVLPDGLLRIGPKAFYGCALLSSVTIPNVVSIEAEAFANCVSLTFLRFPDSLTTLGSLVISGSNVTTVLLPTATALSSDGLGSSNLQHLYLTGDVDEITEAL
jgi:hypothetical protein